MRILSTSAKKVANQIAAFLIASHSDMLAELIVLNLTMQVFKLLAVMPSDNKDKRGEQQQCNIASLNAECATG
ncbi:hypothetical protein LaR308_12185 [Lacticaseibacillus rhamnosus]|nr:hypothetical protein LaR308_12185 [Lacticaseibacillus rhamnosus]